MKFKLNEQVWVYNLGGYPLGLGTIVKITEDELDVWYSVKLPNSKYNIRTRQSLNLLRKLEEGDGENWITAHPRSIPPFFIKERG